MVVTWQDVVIIVVVIVVVVNKQDVVFIVVVIQDKEKAAHRKNVVGMEKRGLLLEWYSATAQVLLFVTKRRIKKFEIIKNILR